MSERINFNSRRFYNHQKGIDNKKYKLENADTLWRRKHSKWADTKREEDTLLEPKRKYRTVLTTNGIVFAIPKGNNLKQTFSPAVLEAMKDFAKKQGKQRKTKETVIQGRRR